MFLANSCLHDSILLVEMSRKEANFLGKEQKILFYMAQLTSFIFFIIILKGPYHADLKYYFVCLRNDISCFMILNHVSVRNSNTHTGSSGKE